MSNEIATTDQTTGRKVAAYSSIKGEDFESRRELFAALSDAKPLQDHLGKPISVKHVVIMPIEVTDEITGEVDTIARTTLVAADGSAFSAASRGIDNSIQQIFSVFGEPYTWPEPITFVASREGAGTNKYMTLRLAK